MKKVAVLLAVFAGTLWGVIGYFVRTLQENSIDSMQIVFIRMGISAVMFLLFALVFNRKLFVIKLKDIWCFIGTGVISVAVFSFCYFKCIEYSSLSVASVLLYTAPIFVMMFSVLLFKEKLSAIKILSLVMAFCGCLFVTGVFTQNNDFNVVAVMFGVMSGVCYALYSIFTRYALNRNYSPLTITLYTFVFSAIASFLVIPKKEIISYMTDSVDNMVFCVVFALLSSVLPYVAYTLSLKYIKPSTASIVASAEPVVATITGYFVFSEEVQFPYGYIGIALVIISIILINLIPDNKKEAHD